MEAILAMEAILSDIFGELPPSMGEDFDIHQTSRYHEVSKMVPHLANLT